MEEDDYFDDYEDGLYENCPKCGRFYDHIDFDYQCCSKCGWDTETQRHGGARDPEAADYEMGDADILTGLWN